MSAGSRCRRARRRTSRGTGRRGTSRLGLGSPARSASRRPRSRRSEPSLSCLVPPLALPSPHLLLESELGRVLGRRRRRLGRRSRGGGRRRGRGGARGNRGRRGSARRDRRVRGRGLRLRPRAPAGSPRRRGCAAPTADHGPSACVADGDSTGTRVEALERRGGRRAERRSGVGLQARPGLGTLPVRDDDGRDKGKRRHGPHRRELVRRSRAASDPRKALGGRRPGNALGRHSRCRAARAASRPGPATER